MTMDFITRQPGSGNPYKGNPVDVFWKCEHGDTKGPISSSELEWDNGSCAVMAYRPAVKDDPALADAKIYETCNVIGHLAIFGPHLMKEALFRIIKGEEHTKVIEEVFKKINPATAMALLLTLE